MEPAEKVREVRLRRAADRQGLRLSRSRRRDPRALDFGRYYLHNIETDEVVGPAKGQTVDEVEEYLLHRKPNRGRCLVKLSEYVSAQIEASQRGEAPSDAMQQLWGVTNKVSGNDDLAGIVEALRHAVEAEDVHMVGTIGAGMAALAIEVEVAEEIEASPRTS